MTVKTRATILSEAAANINDNNIGDVTPADVRQRVVDLADSYAVLAEDLGKGTGVALAGTMSFGVGSLFHITAGTGPITDVDFANPWDGREAVLVADVAFTLTYNATTLRVPGAASLSVAIGDVLFIVQDSGDNVIVTDHVKAAGLTKSDVGLSNVDNTSNATERAAAATLSNKRISPRVNTIASSATPTTNTDNYDIVDITALAAAITSMSSGLTGTPTIGDILVFQIKDNGAARAITWGASFTAKGVALPTTTVLSKLLTVSFMWNGSNWGCVGSAQEV